MIKKPIDDDEANKGWMPLGSNGTWPFKGEKASAVLARESGVSRRHVQGSRLDRYMSPWMLRSLRLVTTARSIGLCTMMLAGRS